MSFDPYAALQVDRSTSPDGIKAAYRRRARATHPDIAKTYNADAFQEVVRAFDILSDPERRKRFDETGSADETNPVEDRAAAMQVLAGLFETMVSKASERRARLVSINFISGISELLQRNITDANSILGDLKHQADERLALRKRIARVGDGPNVFADKLTAQITSLERGQADQRQRLRILKLAEVEVGNYDNEVEMIAAFQTVQFGYAPSSSAGAGAWTVTKAWPT